MLVHFWSTLHGYIAGYNNTLLNYMHENPISVKEEMLDLIHDTFVREILIRRTIAIIILAIAFLCSAGIDIFIAIIAVHSTA